MVKKNLLEKYGKKTEEEYLKEKEEKIKALEQPKYEKKKSKAYWLRYDNKIVIIKLMNNVEFEGKLHTDLYNRYEILIELKTGVRVLIPKHAVLYVVEKSKGVKNHEESV